MRKTKTRSIAKFKRIFVLFFFAAIICVPVYSIAAGDANDNSKAGQLKAAVDTENSEVANEWESVQMRVTAYCPCPKCCGNYSDGITASGHRISQGDRFVAADRAYPFGTEMIIPGYKSDQPVKVLDRGGAIQGTRLDVFFNSHQEALNWGVRYLNVKIRR